MVTTILSLLGLLPQLITAAEQLWSAFPGQGRVKKDAVLSSLSAFTNAANTLGSKIDPTQITQTASNLIDDYVGVQNAIGAFQHNR